jgi:hypothetical protein
MTNAMIPCPSQSILLGSAAVPQRRRWPSAAVWIVIMLACIARPVAADAPVTEAEVRAMVEALVAKIRSIHDPGRHWEPVALPEGNTGQATGRTALAVLALLEAGEPAQSDKVYDAIKWLAANPAPFTYATATRIMVWTRLPADFRPLAEADLRRLLENFSSEAGGWDYGPNPRVGYVDQSLTQFAMQAIADAEQAGLDVPPRLIDMVRGRFLSKQGKDGGWGYKNAEDEPRGSMTAAGLATMALCERVRPGNDRTRDAVARSINGAVEWLDERFEPGANPGMGDYHVYYWMHALERAGRATGLRRFRDRDWFDAIAGTIRSRLFFGDLESGLRVRDTSDMETLAFALFTLQRGLEPVPFGFFETTGLPPAYDELGEAATRLSDVIEKPVGWTRVGVDDPISVWSRLPVVVVRGDGAAEWLKDPASPEAARLLAYAAAGGTVVAAPADRGRFAKSMMELFTTAFPHLVESKIDTKDEVRSEPTIWRGRADQLSTPVRRWLVTSPKLPLGQEGASKQTEDVSTMLSAICLAETGGVLPSRAWADKESEVGVTASFPITRFRYDGAWQPEPAVLDRLVSIAAGAGLEIDREADASGVVGGSGLVWITGASKSDAEAIDLDIVGEASKQGRRLFIESLDPQFVATLTARMTQKGWSVGPPPPGCPTGTARVSPPGAVGGLLVTSEISRPLLGRPSKSGVTVADVLKVIRTAATLESSGG